MSKVNSWKLTQYVIRNVEDEPSTKLVMLSLASYVRENWTTSVAISTLVKETGLSRNTVRKVLRQLELDERIYKMAGGRQNHSSAYIISEPVGYEEWAVQMFGRKESQRVNHEPQRVKSERSEGQPLTPRRIKKIKEEQRDENLIQVRPLIGPARREALTAARLISKASKSQN
jgi:hypothetical protein